MEAEKYQQFLIDYDYDGARWSLTIPATSFEDAKRRIQHLQYGKVVGTVEAVLPVQAGFLARLICWWKNRPQ